MIYLSKYWKIGSFIIFILPSLCTAATEDEFPSQLMYELMYDSDYEGGVVSKLINECIGTIDFSVIVNFPQFGYYTRKHLMDWKPIISRNVYTGNFGPDDKDERRPSTQSGNFTDKLIKEADEGGTKNFLCDVLFWDFVEFFAESSQNLVNETILEIRKRDDPKAERAFIQDIIVPLSKIQRLMNANPRRDHFWSYKIGY